MYISSRIMADNRAVLLFRVLNVILLLQKTTGCQDPCSAVGLDDSNIIPDSSFTASSELRDRYGAKKARFSSDYCWEPNGSNDPDDYLQIDLGKVFAICAVATMGSARLREWTKQYKISTSSDGNLWITYSDNNSSKLFPGNTDGNTVVKNDLAIPVLANFIRFTPTQYYNYKALRVEVYGIDVQDFSCKSLSVGVASVTKIPAKSMTSSSQYNASTPPSNGRLGYPAGSSWCAAIYDSSPYLQVKLSSPYIICGVATQGDHKPDQWIQTYQIQTSTDGSSFTDYKHNNVIKDFVGNTDSGTIVKNLLYEGTVSQYIRINAMSDYGTTSCMRTELYGVQQNTVCSKMSVGVPYSSLVPDHRLSASSYYHNGYIPSYARLRNTKAWEPKTQNVGDWLQIDLGSVVYVCAVATQGNAYNYRPNEYAKKYKLRISLDNFNWRYYQESNADKVFTGNTDKTTIVTNTLAVPTKTKFLRFYPTEFKDYAAMRVDVYGVPATCSSPFGVEKGGSVKDSNMTSSSQSNSSHAASFGRLYGNASWCSNTSSNTEYIQIDLGKMVTLTGIATQGDHTMDKWVKIYTLKYSIDGSVWNDYRGDQLSAKVFQGNSDKNSIVVRWFIHQVTVRYVRVYPQSWNTAICMRVELFGCTCLRSAPHNVTVSVIPPIGSAGPRIKIDWDRPLSSYGIIRGYKVSYGKTGDPNPRLVTLSSSTFTALLPVCGGERYNLELWAFNSNEEAKVKQSVSIPNYVPNAPKDIKYAKYNTTTYRLSWQPVTSVCGQIIVYEMKTPKMKIQSYEKKEMINISCSEVPCGGSVNHDCSYFLHNTQNCFLYNISVRAYTTKGPGPFSKVLVLQSPALQMTPKEFTVILVDHNTASLEWKEPDNIILPIKYYTIKYSGQSPLPTRACNDSYLKEAITNSTKITITGLYPATRYRFTVSATTECGEGEDSEEQVNQTKPDQDVKKGKSQEDICSTAETNFHISLSFNMVFIVIIILLLIYNRYLRNKVEEQSTKRNSNYEEKASPQQIVYENTGSVDRGPDEEIQLSDIPTTIAQVYDSIDEYQNYPSPPTTPSTSQGNSNTSAGDLPSKAYQALDISQQNQGSVYEELNQTTKAEVPLSSGQSRDSSNYQPLAMGVQSSPYQRLHGKINQQ